MYKPSSTGAHVHSGIRSMSYDLRAPKTADEWRTYHAIRRVVLWEAREIFGEYDERHPDEFKPNHFPKILYLDGEPIGVIRIDVAGDTAWFRRVAIMQKHQRAGHGRALMQCSERFALEHGVQRIESSVDRDAISFYRKMGYFSRDVDETSMYKILSR